MKKILIIVFFLLLLVGGLVVYLFKPYESFSESRKDTQLVTLKVEFVNVTGDPGCTKLYEVSNNKVDYLKPVYPAHIRTMPALDDGDHAYDKNRFVLKGYRYQYVKRNLLTGSMETRPSARLDVVAWNIETPYTAWTNKTDKDGRMLAQVKNDKLVYSIGKGQHATENFRIDNYTNCMAGQTLN